jgi:hypothetical protein
MVKPKRKTKRSTVRQVVALIIGGIVVLIAIFAVLALSGPSIGSVFSNVIQELDTVTPIATAVGAP